MRLSLIRDRLTERSTVGQLSVDGIFECYTLEDVVRPSGVKVPGQTAIPEGVYDVVLDFSQRFQRVLPRLLQVPGFTGIRLHAGNTAADTEGCILVGQTRYPDGVGNSRLALHALLDKLTRATEPIVLEIVTLPNLGGVV